MPRIIAICKKYNIEEIVRSLQARKITINSLNKVKMRFNIYFDQDLKAQIHDINDEYKKLLYLNKVKIIVIEQLIHDFRSLVHNIDFQLNSQVMTFFCEDSDLDITIYFLYAAG